VDDSAVHSDAWRSHLIHNEEFLKVMRKEGITLNLNNSRFAQQAVKFCGEIVGSGRRSPDPDKVAAIKDLKVPETKKQLRGILGFFAYFRRHLKGFADKAKILTDLTAKRVPQNIKSHWTEAHSEALERLKQDLIKACEASLHIIRLDRPFHVYVEASSFAAGGHLGQLNDEGVECPISFYSTKLTATQRNWSTIEREAFAVLLALNIFKQWFFGSKIIIHSDHNPLTFLTESAPKSGKLMRWSLALAEYDIEFRFNAGKLNVPTDTLSRLGSGAYDQSGNV